MDYLAEFFAQLKIFEGCIPWMYLDTKGNVTCAIGIMLATTQAACQLPFYPENDPQPATEDQIVAEWTRVKAMAPAKLPAFYHGPSSLVLMPSEIETLTMSVLQQKETELRQLYPGYDGFPDMAKMALLDMDYNMGEEDLRVKWPHFDAAVDAQEWSTVAGLCHRLGIQPERNAWTEQQFLSAATQAA